MNSIGVEHRYVSLNIGMWLAVFCCSYVVYGLVEVLGGEPAEPAFVIKNVNRQSIIVSHTHRRLREGALLRTKPLCSTITQGHKGFGK